MTVATEASAGMRSISSYETGGDIPVAPDSPAALARLAVQAYETGNIHAAQRFEAEIKALSPHDLGSRAVERVIKVA